MPDSTTKIFFTVEKANQALPLVRSIVSDIVKQFQEVNDRKQRLDRIRESRGSGGRSAHPMYDDELRQVEDELEADISRLQEFVEELDRIGVELKDVNRGLVDFPAMMDGHEVYLCWHLGEDKVGFWHELDAGFGGRQALDVSCCTMSPQPTVMKSDDGSLVSPSSPVVNSTKKITR
ncbi:MAG: DUF2203 domain-containing protein [Planctomycetales bacterium]|nr:DUF2203 domain-containing protein [Planctomycetales bacterium]